MSFKTFAQPFKGLYRHRSIDYPQHKQELINGDLGFVFSEVEMDRVSEDMKFALFLKFLYNVPH